MSKVQKVPIIGTRESTMVQLVIKNRGAGAVIDGILGGVLQVIPLVELKIKGWKIQ